MDREREREREREKRRLNCTAMEGVMQTQRATGALRREDCTDRERHREKESRLLTETRETRTEIMRVGVGCVAVE